MSTGPSALLRAGVAAQVRAMRSGDTSAVDLTRAALEAVARHDADLAAMSVVLGEAALREAAQRDADLLAGRAPGPLHGVPVVIKEENDVAGAVTTFGGRGNSTPAAGDGHVTARLREAGAVVVGKTTMPEFGQVPFTESRRHGCTRNPWDRERSPGGSSGGSAVAVAAGFVPVGIGGDGGGSIRIPAALTGLFGLKPSRGLVSTAPEPALWNALGVPGPLTRGVLDSALVYDVITGNTPGDAFTLPDPRDAWGTSFADAARGGADGDVPALRVGWSVASPTPGVRPCREHVDAVRATAVLLAGLGHVVAEARPRYPDVTTAFLPQMLDGVRHEADVVEHPDLLEPRTRQLAAVGRLVRPRLVSDAVARGEALAHRVDQSVLGPYDVLLTPVVPHRPAPLGRLERAGLVPSMLRSLPVIAYTALWNVTGHPAASVPVGFARDGLPLAVQIVARRGAEPLLLRLAAQIEHAQPWGGRWPVL